MTPEERLDRLEKIVESNARSIRAFSGEWGKDRKILYQLLSRLTRSMSDFYEIQSDFYARFDQIDARQADMTQILQELKGEQSLSDDSDSEEEV